MSAAPPGRPRRLAGPLLAALAGLVHLAFDALSSRLEATTPPYLLLDHAAEMFREILATDRTAILASVSVAAAAVQGVIAAIFAAAFEEAGHRLRTLAITLTAVWILSGALLELVYLTLPWGLAAGSLLAGIPRALVVAWALDRALPRRVSKATGE